jgi:hypothetical protein
VTDSLRRSKINAPGTRLCDVGSSPDNGRQYAILAFSESSDYVSDVQTPKRRPVQRERIVLNLDRCRKFVELLERRVETRPIRFTSAGPEKRDSNSIALGDRTVIQVDHFGNALKRETDL